MDNISKDKIFRICRELGHNIKIARKFRKLPSRCVAETVGISRPTLWKIEKGSPSVAIGSYIQVLLFLGLEKNLIKIAMKETSVKKFGLTVF
jgi:DNA-binding XRE family transcriptional regulator